MTSDDLEDGYNDVISAKEIYTETIVKQYVYIWRYNRIYKFADK